jgi:uncharacterized protein (DUF433 family)
MNAIDDRDLARRIVVAPAVMTGKPVIRGTRLTVDLILNLLAHGQSEQDILAEYDGLTAADIRACLLFATHSIESTAFMPLMLEPA